MDVTGIGVIDSTMEYRRVTNLARDGWLAFDEGGGGWGHGRPLAILSNSGLNFFNVSAMTKIISRRAWNKSQFFSFWVVAPGLPPTWGRVVP